MSRHEDRIRCERQARDDAYYAQEWVMRAELQDHLDEIKQESPLPRIPVTPGAAGMLGHHSQAQQEQWIDDMKHRYGEEM